MLEFRADAKLGHPDSIEFNGGSSSQPTFSQQAVPNSSIRFSDPSLKLDSIQELNPKSSLDLANICSPGVSFQANRCCVWVGTESSLQASLTQLGIICFQPARDRKHACEGSRTLKA